MIKLLNFAQLCFTLTETFNIKSRRCVRDSRLEKYCIDFYNTYGIKEKFSNLRNLAQNVMSSFGSTFTCESFFF